MRLAPAIGRLTSAEARVVLSGLRPDEAGLLLEPYRGQGFVWRWQAQERGWCVMGLERRPAAPGLD
jgi:ribosomal protein L11 methylase PrmA